MGTVIETEESVEHFRATSDFTVCLSPRQRVTEKIHWPRCHRPVIDTS